MRRHKSTRTVIARNWSLDARCTKSINSPRGCTYSRRAPAGSWSTLPPAKCVPFPSDAMWEWCSRRKAKLSATACVPTGNKSYRTGMIVDKCERSFSPAYMQGNAMNRSLHTHTHAVRFVFSAKDPLGSDRWKMFSGSMWWVYRGVSGKRHHVNQRLPVAVKAVEWSKSGKEIIYNVNCLLMLNTLRFEMDWFGKRAFFCVNILKQTVHLMILGKWLLNIFCLKRIFRIFFLSKYDDLYTNRKRFGLLNKVRL